MSCIVSSHYLAAMCAIYSSRSWAALDTLLVKITRWKSTFKLVNLNVPAFYLREHSQITILLTYWMSEWSLGPGQTNRSWLSLRRERLSPPKHGLLCPVPVAIFCMHWHTGSPLRPCGPESPSDPGGPCGTSNIVLARRLHRYDFNVFRFA